MKKKNQFPKTLFFFDFSNTLKQMKIDLLNPKTLLKLVAKTLKKMEILALEKLVENSSRGGKFIAPQNLPVGSLAKGKIALPVDRPVDWPTVIFMTVGPPVDRDWIH